MAETDTTPSAPKPSAEHLALELVLARRAEIAADREVERVELENSERDAQACRHLEAVRNENRARRARVRDVASAAWQRRSALEQALSDALKEGR